MSIRSFVDSRKGCLRDGPPIRGRWLMRDGKLIDISKAAIAEAKAAAFHRDEMLDGVESPITGEKFYSKSALLQHYKENGYECTGGSHLNGNKNIKPPIADGAKIRADTEMIFNKIRNDEIPVIDKGDPIPADNLYMTRQELESTWNQEERNFQNYKRRHR